MFFLSFFKKAKKVMKYPHYYAENLIRKLSGKSNMNPATNGEYLVLKKIISNIDNEFIYFDGGAYLGDHLLYVNEMISGFSSLNIRSFAIEATPSTFKLLKKRLKNLNVICINKALSDEELDIDFYIDSDTNFTDMNNKIGSHSTIPYYYLVEGKKVMNNRLGSYSALPHYYLEKRNKIKIPTIKIDSIVKEYNINSIDFLKLDIEGYEVKALQGAINCLGKGIIKYIQLEYNQTWILAGNTIKDILDLCESYGYDLYRICPKELLKISFYHYILDDFVFCNLLLIKRGCKLPIPCYKGAIPTQDF